MGRLLFCLALFFPLVLRSQSRPSASGSDTIVENIVINSNIFRNERTLRILLPRGYYDSSNKEKKYPVLFLNDGFSVFKNWKVKETVYRLVDSGLIKPLIVVGIDNAINNVNTNPDFRTNEYLPYPEETEPSVPNPQGKLYPDFLIEEVIPLINKHYRILPGKDNTGIGGSSYGGYISLYTYFQRPDVFGRLLLESTPFFISKNKIINEAAKFTHWNGKIVIGIGTQETPDTNINLKGMKAENQIVEIIRQHANTVQLKTIITPGASHNAKAWAARLPEDIVFLFGKE